MTTMDNTNDAERLTNEAAELLVAHDEQDSLPALRLGFPDDDHGDAVLVFAYWKGGELVVSVDTDDAPERVVAVRVNVNDHCDAYRTTIVP